MTGHPHAIAFDNSQEGSWTRVRNDHMGIIFISVLRPHMQPPSHGGHWGPRSQTDLTCSPGFAIYTSPGTLDKPLPPLNLFAQMHDGVPGAPSELAGGWACVPSPSLGIVMLGPQQSLLLLSSRCLDKLGSPVCCSEPAFCRGKGELKSAVPARASRTAAPSPSPLLLNSRLVL